MTKRHQMQVMRRYRQAWRARSCSVLQRPRGGLDMPKQQRAWRAHPAVVLASISCGGVLGTMARYGLSIAFPHPPDQMPWATLSINASGCLLIGVLMALITEMWSDQQLLRPFLGVGVLGGYTTFSTYVIDIQQAIAAGAPHLALLYLALTVVSAMLGIWTGGMLTGGLVRVVRKKRSTS